jgi:2-polyprenyl-3-methyl-5-hydroxy-6-metoxy-1,4-benzoquinol methylase
VAHQTVAQSSALTESSAARQDTNVFENEGVRVRSVENCLLCGRRGQPLYTGLRDRLFDAPGTWDLLRCKNCGLVWLNPQPIPEDIPKLYRSYYTHQNANEPSRPLRFRQKLTQAVRATVLGYDQLLPGPRWRLPRPVVSLIRPWGDHAFASLMYLEASARGSLLDVGCGSGAFLATMRNLGWDVHGVEPDPEAAVTARGVHHLPVLNGTLEDVRLPDASFDAITMNHVIEHVLDPQFVLKDCGRLLRVGGRLVVVTPNVESLGHLLFRRSWFALDPPRHVHLFSIGTLQRAAKGAGLEIKTLRTLSRMSRLDFIHSVLIAHHGRTSLDGDAGHGHLVRIGSWNFWAFEELLRHVSPGVGEELLLIAEKAPIPN